MDQLLRNNLKKQQREAGVINKTVEVELGRDRQIQRFCRINWFGEESKSIKDNSDF